MKLDYSFFATSVEDVATDMLIDAVSERSLDFADELGEIIRTCRKINRMIPITSKEEQNYITEIVKDIDSSDLRQKLENLGKAVFSSKKN